MNIESLACSFELAEQLKKLDVNQDSYFYYHWYKKNRDYERIECDILSSKMEDFDDGKWKGKCYSAFTVGELMDLLPAFVDTKKNEPFNFFNLVIQKKTAHNIKYIINYHCDTIQVDSGSAVFSHKLCAHNIYDEKLTDCLAKMLIYLIENGLIKNE